MVKHTQTIRRQHATNCLSVFDHFVGLALQGLKEMKEDLLKNLLTNPSFFILYQISLVNPLSYKA